MSAAIPPTSAILVPNLTTFASFAITTTTTTTATTTATTTTTTTAITPPIAL